ncbi:MAG: carboxypeptidase regulatory-like domain-containing protein [Nitrospirota bacterium]|nr:carboxypeptidase regulatory-like domain-containing protein [Nitrospirota bacterium]
MNTLPDINYPTSAALAFGDPGLTAISGVVLDNTNVPIPDVTVRVEGTTREAVTDAEGQFILNNAPVGPIHLIVDGSTAGVPGVVEYPILGHDISTVSGASNGLGMPIYLVPLDLTNAKLVGGADAVSYTLEGVPGFELTVHPNSTTFPDGSSEGYLSVTTVHGDKVPMVPQMGQQPSLIVTIQPPGVVFDPPATLTMPNVDGMGAGEKTNMFSFDHDIGAFVSIGTGSVSEDGMLLVSDPGVGVVKSGWHCGANPDTPGDCCSCGDCKTCDGNGDCTVEITLNSVTVYANGKTELVVPVDASVQFTPIPDASNCKYNHQWDFKDGGRSTDRAPLHKFTSPGEYTVNLDLTCNHCSKSVAATVKVTVVGVAVVSSAPKNGNRHHMRVIDGSNSSTFTCEVTPSTATVDSWAWEWRVWPGAGSVGNSPNVAFSSPSGQTTTVLNAHWYSIPDTQFHFQNMLPGGSPYAIDCAATVGGINMSSRKDDVSLDGALSVEFDPHSAAGASMEGQFFANFDSASGQYVIVQGTLSRTSPYVVSYGVPVTSQFYNKVRAHEDYHVFQWTGAAPWKDLFQPSIWMSAVQGLFYPTLVDAMNAAAAATMQFSAADINLTNNTQCLREWQAYQIDAQASPNYREWTQSDVSREYGCQF